MIHCSYLEPLIVFTSMGKGAIMSTLVVSMKSMSVYDSQHLDKVPGHVPYISD